MPRIASSEERGTTDTRLGKVFSGLGTNDFEGQRAPPVEVHVAVAFPSHFHVSRQRNVQAGCRGHPKVNSP